VIIKVIGTGLLLELQLHIEPFYKLKVETDGNVSIPDMKGNK